MSIKLTFNLLKKNYRKRFSKNDKQTFIFTCLNNMKQIFNDSSQVAKCLNYQFDLNKDKISSFDSQQIYLSRYKMDYKTPKMTKKFNSSKNIESYECKCDCGKCHDINVDSYIQKTSSFTANKMADYKFESNKSNN